jgi:hypothetical protein
MGKIVLVFAFVHVPIWPSAYSISREQPILERSFISAQFSERVHFLSRSFSHSPW